MTYGGFEVLADVWLHSHVTILYGFILAYLIVEAHGFSSNAAKSGSDIYGCVPDDGCVRISDFCSAISGFCDTHSIVT